MTRRQPRRAAAAAAKLVIARLTRAGPGRQRDGGSHVLTRIARAGCRGLRVGGRSPLALAS